MQISDPISFITGAAIVHVPLQILPMNGNDVIIEIGFFAAKSIIGGVVSIGVAHVINKISKPKNKNTEQ